MMRSIGTSLNAISTSSLLTTLAFILLTVLDVLSTNKPGPPMKYSIPYHSLSGFISIAPGTSCDPPVASFIQEKNDFTLSGDLNDIEEAGTESSHLLEYTGEPKYVSLVAISTIGFSGVGITDLRAL